ncbi:MAG: DNA polymerase/3'-5' exonuclease PolX [Candidatus Micrarchaeia archaeon]
MNNEEIARIFFEIADILEMQDVKWKPEAYRRAARLIQSLPEELSELRRKQKLEELPGIGEAIAKKINELLDTGKLEYYERLKKDFPVDVYALTSVPSLGPKKLKVLYEKLGVKSIEDLKKAALEHRISGLPGFKERSEEKILEGIALFESAQKRKPLPHALREADKLASYLKSTGYASIVELAGSIRRRKETVGDIDILAVSENPEKIMEAFVSFPEVMNIIGKGQTKSSVLLKSGMNADLRVVEQGSFGSALMYFTGSKEHNIELRKLAHSKGFKLNEYGVFRGDEKIGGNTEEEVYNLLGIEYIPPEIRENKGEISLAIERKLPKLVEQGDIQGDLHMHTVMSDGSDDVRMLAEKGQKMGYEYIGITEHIKKKKTPNALGEEDAKAYVEKIRSTETRVKLLCGAEVDIGSDGMPEISKSVLSLFDFVIGAVHYGFEMESNKLNERIERAINNDDIHIIAHPSGRKFGVREKMPLDFGRIFSLASEKGKILEINSCPDRLDLNDALAREALQHGALLTICSDAHSAVEMENIVFGVYMARRAWAEKRHILNSLPYQELKKRLGF